MPNNDDDDDDLEYNGCRNFSLNSLVEYIALKVPGVEGREGRAPGRGGGEPRRADG